MLLLALALLYAASAAEAKAFKNCTALNKTCNGSGAKTEFAKQSAIANGVETPPVVNAKVHAEIVSKDRDKDGVACEK